MTDWTPEGGAASTWTPGAPTKLNRGVLEYEEDFEGASPKLSGISTTLRPDALSLDYQTAYTMGPVAIGDVTQGVLARTWRLKYHDGGYYVSRSNDANDAWEDETLLFTDARLPRELDVAFDQQARVFVCAEIAGHVWAYFYDVATSQYLFTDLGVGVTPRCVLDSPFDTTIADVLVFYMNRTRGTLSYRQQRDRYLVEYDTPISDAPGDTFVEDAARLSGYRVAVLHSVHDPDHGTYELRELESALYPVPVLDSAVILSVTATEGSLVVVVIDESIDAQMQIALSLESGTMTSSEIDHILYDTDQMQIGLGLQSGTLGAPVIAHTLYDKDQMQIGLGIASGTLVVVVLTHTLHDIEQMQISLSLQSGTLA